MEGNKSVDYNFWWVELKVSFSISGEKEEIKIEVTPSSKRYYCGSHIFLKGGVLRAMIP